MTQPYSSLTSASLSGVVGLLRLLQLQFSSSQLDSLAHHPNPQLHKRFLVVFFYGCFMSSVFTVKVFGRWFKLLTSGRFYVHLLIFLCFIWVLSFFHILVLQYACALLTMCGFNYSIFWTWSFLQVLLYTLYFIKIIVKLKEKGKEINKKEKGAKKNEEE